MIYSKHFKKTNPKRSEEQLMTARFSSTTPEQPFYFVLQQV
jgi:hypothetical protein